MSKLITTFQPNGLGISAVSDSSLSFKTVTSATAVETASLSSTGVFTATSFTGSGTGLTAGTTPLTTLDIDGGTDIGADIVDTDLLIIDDGGGGTNRKTAASRFKTYISSYAADPASADGDSLGTASLEWSDLYLADGGVIYFGNDQDINITHVADTGLTTSGTLQVASETSAESFNLPITLNGTDSTSTNAGDNIILDASAAGVDAGERLLYEGIPPNEVSVANLAAGTDGHIITFNADGYPTTVGPGTDGQVLTSTGAGSPPAFEGVTGGYQSMQIFTSSGTWTRPSGISTIIVAVNGAGGGGSGGGGAGGGGTFAMKTIDVSSTASETVTIQSGGSGGGWTASGSSSSGSTSFGSAPSVGGGAGGTAASYKNGGAGGAAGSTGDINISGQRGFPGYGFAANSANGSGGSCGMFGQGGGGGSYGQSAEDGQHGGGGGGGGYGGSGGDGGDGLVVVWEYA